MSMATKGRIVGLDFGLRRIGIAISDPLQVVASALPTLDVIGKPEERAEKLLSLLAPYSPVLIVVGLPLRLDGTSSEMTDHARSFAKLLGQLASLPVVLWDERLTSAQADRTLRQANLTRKKRAAHVDQVSAAIVLQNYLDSQV